MIMNHVNHECILFVTVSLAEGLFQVQAGDPLSVCDRNLCVHVFIHQAIVTAVLHRAVQRQVMLQSENEWTGEER